MTYHVSFTVVCVSVCFPGKSVILWVLMGVKTLEFYGNLQTNVNKYRVRTLHTSILKNWFWPRTRTRALVSMCEVFCLPFSEM